MPRKSEEIQPLPDTRHNICFEYSGDCIALALPEHLFSPDTNPAFGCYCFRAHKPIDGTIPVIFYSDLDDLNGRGLRYLHPKFALLKSNRKSPQFYATFYWLRKNSFKEISKKSFLERICPFKDQRLRGDLKDMGYNIPPAYSRGLK